MTKPKAQKITQIDRAACKTLGAAAERALASVADEYGVTVKRGSGRYSPDAGTFTMKVTFALADSDRMKWESQCGYLPNPAGDRPFAADDFGREFVVRGKTYRISGINLRAAKYPITAVCIDDGRTYKFAAIAVQNALRFDVKRNSERDVA